MPPAIGVWRTKFRPIIRLTQDASIDAAKALAHSHPVVPPDEAWFVQNGKVVAKIVGLKVETL